MQSLLTLELGKHLLNCVTKNIQTIVVTKTLKVGCVILVRRWPALEKPQNWVVLFWPGAGLCLQKLQSWIVQF